MAQVFAEVEDTVRAVPFAAPGPGLHGQVSAGLSRQRLRDKCRSAGFQGGQDFLGVMLVRGNI